MRGIYDCDSRSRQFSRAHTSTLQNVVNFKRRDRWLKFVQFQKLRYPRIELTELFQIRVVPDRGWKFGRTLQAMM